MEQQDVWDDLVGDAWVRNAAILDDHGEPFGLAAIDRLEPLEGKRVLDVGCGNGATTRELARRGATALGVDLSPQMVAEAQHRAEGVARVSHRLGSVEDLDPEDRFDAVCSRFGVMFFEDPVAAFRHLHNLTADDGSIAFAAWTGPLDNPWIGVPMMATVPLLGPPEMAGPDRPGPFSLAPEGRAAEVLEAAGWRDVVVEVLVLERPYAAPSIEAAAAAMMDIAPPIASAVARQPERRDEVHAAIVEALRPHVRDGQLMLASSSQIVSARA